MPEVQANTENLARWIVGRRIVEVEPPASPREAGGVSRVAFTERLEGRRVAAVERRGKWILARLDRDGGLGFHLGMTGKIARASSGAPLPRFTRAVLSLDDGARICFVDSRRFGRVLALPRWEDLLAHAPIAELGPDALLETTVGHLREELARTRRTVKEAIMDQRVLAGVGNLYATEALWRAKIHPAAPAPSVAEDAAAVRRLAEGIRAALRHGIAHYQGEEPPEYIEEGGENPFFAYDRKGEPCPRCKTKIEAMAIGQRTSAFCPKCQPAPRRTAAARREGAAKKRAAS